MLRDWPTGQKLASNEKQPERPCRRRDFPLPGFSLGAGAERFATIAPARSSGRKSRGSRLRSYDGCLRQLRSFSSRSARQRTGPRRSIFSNSGSDSTVGRVGVSSRWHFRARAARALLTVNFPAPAGWRRVARSLRRQLNVRERKFIGRFRPSF